MCSGLRHLPILGEGAFSFLRRDNLKISLEKSVTVVGVMVVLFGSGISGNAQGESSYGGMFVTGGYTSHKGISSGASSGFGVRGKNLGVRLSYIDNAEFDDSKISILPEFFATSQGKKLVDLGSKRTGAEYGIDFDCYYNINETVSLYAAPGIYYAGYQDIKKVDEGGKLSDKAFAGPTKAKYIPAGSAGVHFNIPVSKEPGGRILVGIGYHSQRGVVFDVGARW